MCCAYQAAIDVCLALQVTSTTVMTGVHLMRLVTHQSHITDCGAHVIVPVYYK